jgi:aconitate hydratase
VGCNVARKLIESHLVDGEMIPGREIRIRIDQTLTQDVTGTLVMLELETMGLDGVKTELSAQCVDHNLIQQDHKNPDDHLFLHSACRRFGKVVAPSRVLSRHANDEGLSFGRDRTAARIRKMFGTVEFRLVWGICG